MTGISDAQRAFDAGVLSLGIPIDGLQTPRDLRYAALAFRRATECDPDMCDAWLGRAAAGEVTAEVIYHLYRTSTASLCREQRRLGLAPRTLRARFQTGLFLDYPLSTRTEMWLAYAASMIGSRDYDEAEEVLDELGRLRSEVPGGETASEPICAYVRGVLHFTTQRWPDVLTALSDSASFADEYLAAGAHLMVGSACAQLGLFGEGIRRLNQAIEGPIPAARRAAEFCKGLTLREMGNEDGARVIFERIYSEEPTFAANASALADPKYRLVITTKEDIDSRANRWDPASANAFGHSAADDSAAGEDYLRAAQQQLDDQIGLSEVKLQVAKLKSAAMMAKVRGDKGLSTAARSLHLVFTGPPGTGKTTVARVVAQTYCGLGLLKSATVVEATRHDFVGQHLGSTAIKTTATIDAAMNGVLFIDEAYSLIQTGLAGGDAFGREAVDTLLARMENDRDRLVVIIAGYDDEIDRFLASNEGLASRFTKRIRFSTYTPAELGAIGHAIAQSRDSELSARAHEELVAACHTLHQRQTLDGSGRLRRGIDAVGNARFVRNVIEAAENEREYRLSERHGARLEDLDETLLMRIELPDMQAALQQVLGLLTALPTTGNLT